MIYRAFGTILILVVLIPFLYNVTASFLNYRHAKLYAVGKYQQYMSSLGDAYLRRSILWFLMLILMVLGRYIMGVS
jgi:ABC-type sugar transport system permease subunit